MAGFDRPLTLPNLHMRLKERGSVSRSTWRERSTEVTGAPAPTKKLRVTDPRPGQ